MPLTIIFAGTPDFSVPVLEVLLKSDHQVLSVYTQPDRPAGRGRGLKASPIKRLAEKHGLSIHQPDSLQSEAEQALLKSYQADIMVVAAYGLLLPEAILTIPRLGCINVHASLLPRWRGASPIQQAILGNDKKTGITIVQMNKGLDTGDILLQDTCDITAQDNSQTLNNRLALLGATLLLKSLKEFEDNKTHPKKQNEQLARSAPKIKKSQAQLDWKFPADKLALEVRAFNPWPISYIFWHKKHLRIWKAIVVDDEISIFKPGTLVRANSKALDVATGRGLLRLLILQLPGGKPQDIVDFFNAHRNELKVGEIFQ